MIDLSSRPVLSLVVPVKDEEEALPIFFERVLPPVKTLVSRFEIILVDDGSTDQTVAVIQDWRDREPSIRLISLSRNFGKEAAMTAGLHFAYGAAVIPLDVDLQDPPELIEDMLVKWREGFDVVYGMRSGRPQDGVLKRITADRFYALINRISDFAIPPNTGDFRLMDQQVVEALRGLPERTRFMKGIFAMMGFRQAVVHYVRPERSVGPSKFRFWSLWNFALDGITSFSSTPLRIWSYVGAVIAVFGIFYGLYIAIATVIYGRDVPGFATIVVLISVLGGLQLFSIGVLGEYVARIFVETKRRPIYIARLVDGFDQATLDEVRMSIAGNAVLPRGQARRDQVR